MLSYDRYDRYEQYCSRVGTTFPSVNKVPYFLNQFQNKNKSIFAPFTTRSCAPVNTEINESCKKGSL